jgi:hypothetical protein
MQIRALRVVFSLLVLAEPIAALDRAEIAAATPQVTRHLRALTQILASNRLRGRDNNTAHSALSQRILVRLLKRYGDGLDATRSGDEAYAQPFVLNNQVGANLLAVIRGRELPEEYVFVGAHYDHLGSRSDSSGRCFAIGMPGGRPCNGATDNATGVATVMAIAEAIRVLPQPPRRSVVLALWDSEEDGLIGSRYYVAHPLVPLAQTVAYVNFDILGQDLLPSLKRTSFSIGGETGGPDLQALVDAAVAGEPLDLRPVSYLFGQERSDYKSFVDRRVPTVFFSDATGPCYHTIGDDLSIVNFSKLRAQARTAFRLVIELAERTDRLPFAGRRGLPAVYEDATSLHQVFQAAQSDEPLFMAADRSVIAEARQRTAAVVAKGAEQFTTDDMFALLGDAIATINALTRIECRRF